MSTEENNVIVLVEAKKDFTKRLIDMLRPHMHEGFKSLYDSSIKLCRENNNLSDSLFVFQKKMAQIPNWSQEIVSQEYERIQDVTKCDWLDKLITTTLVAHAKVLTIMNDKRNKSNKEVTVKIPKPEYFLHKCYIQAAREFWKYPYLFSDKVNPVDYQRNMRDAENIIAESINETIRVQLPFKHFLQESLQDDYESDDNDNGNVEETLSSTQQNNLKKMVKRELDMLKGKKLGKDKVKDLLMSEIEKFMDQEVDDSSANQSEHFDGNSEPVVKTSSPDNVDTPVDTPVETPVDTPVETPVDTPVEKPVETVNNDVNESVGDTVSLPDIKNMLQNEIIKLEDMSTSVPEHESSEVEQSGGAFGNMSLDELEELDDLTNIDDLAPVNIFARGGSNKEVPVETESDIVNNFDSLPKFTNSSQKSNLTNPSAKKETSPVSDSKNNNKPPTPANATEYTDEPLTDDELYGYNHNDSMTYDINGDSDYENDRHTPSPKPHVNLVEDKQEDETVKTIRLDNVKGAKKGGNKTKKNDFDNLTELDETSSELSESELPVSDTEDPELDLGLEDLETNAVSFGSEPSTTKRTANSGFSFFNDIPDDE